MRCHLHLKRNWSCALGLLLLARCQASGQEKQQEPTRLLNDHSRWVSQVQFFDGGKKLASAGGDGTVKIWDTNTWKVLDSYDTKNHDQTGLAISNDGRYLASRSINRGLWVVDLISKRNTILFPDWIHERKGEYGINSIVFAPDNKTLITGDSFGSIKYIDVPACFATGKVQRLFQQKLDPYLMHIICASRDRKSLVICGSEKENVSADRQSFNIVPGTQFTLWDIAGRKVLAEFPGPRHESWWPALRDEKPRRRAIYPTQASTVNGSLVYCFDNNVFIFDTDKRKETTLVKAEKNEDSYSIQRATVTPGFKTLAIAEERFRIREGKTQRIRLIDLTTNKDKQILQSGEHLRHLEFSPDGSMLACCSSSTIRIYDLTK